jgi:hypothetical protein
VDAEAEWELKMAVMQADLENKRADTTLKRRLGDYEPWKIVLASMTAGAAMLGSGAALLGLILHWMGKL